MTAVTKEAMQAMVQSFKDSQGAVFNTINRSLQDTREEFSLIQKKTVETVQKKIASAKEIKWKS